MSHGFRPGIAALRALVTHRRNAPLSLLERMALSRAMRDALHARLHGRGIEAVVLSDSGLGSRLERYTERLAHGLESAAREAGVPARVLDQATPIASMDALVAAELELLARHLPDRVITRLMCDARLDMVFDRHLRAKRPGARPMFSRTV